MFAPVIGTGVYCFILLFLTTTFYGRRRHIHLTLQLFLLYVNSFVAKRNDVDLS